MLVIIAAYKCKEQLFIYNEANTYLNMQDLASS